MTAESPTPIRIILADDHEIFRDGFETMLSKQKDIELVGQASNGVELIQQVAALLPDVIITDIKMPLMDGIEATRILQKDFPEMGIIAFSMFDEDSLIIDMLEAGARGYLLKNTSKNEVFEAIKTVYSGEGYYCHKTSVKLAQLIGKSNFNPYKKISKNKLTEREIELIGHICRELTNKEIASAMDLSMRTIEDYRAILQEKLEVKNTAGIVIYAIKNGLYKI